MRKSNGILIFLLSVALCMTLAMGQKAYADPINVGDTIYLSTMVSGFNGGPFGVRSSPTGGPLFITFCLERDEYFYPNQGYTVYNISDTATAGGANTNGGDLLDPRTAYLYTMFRNQQLSSLINFDYNNSDHLISLQKAIWLIEEEISSTDDVFANALVVLAAGKWTDIGNVRVINLGVDGRNQDQLVLVPEPTTLLLLGSGLGGLALFRRYRRRAN